MALLWKRKSRIITQHSWWSPYHISVLASHPHAPASAGPALCRARSVGISLDCSCDENPGDARVGRQIIATPRCDLTIAGRNAIIERVSADLPSAITAPGSEYNHTDTSLETAVDDWCELLWVTGVSCRG